VVGAGAVGGFYGAKLATVAELDVSFLMRSDLAHVKQNGLRVDSVDGENIYLSDVQASASTKEIGPVDLVVIALKATDNQVLEEAIPPLLHENTLLLTLQNGLGNEDYLAKRFGAERVLGGLCFVCLNRTAPGVIRHIGHGLIEMGRFSGPPCERTQQIAELFNRGGVRCEVVEDLELSRWRKLVWNIPFNGLAIVAGGIGVEEILADAELHARIKRLMAEVIETACQLGLSIPAKFAKQNIERTYPMGNYQPSTLLDFLDGRAIELEAIWGEPLRRGQSAGIAMPELEKLYQQIRTKTQ